MKAMNLSFESPHTGGSDSAGSLVCYSDFMFHRSMVTWEMERKSWLTADICFLGSPCLSFTYNLPFFSHSKYQYLDVFFFFNFLSYSVFLSLSWQCFEACCSRRPKSRCKEVWSTTSAFSRL